MSVTGTILPGASRLARLQVELSKKARQRLKWFDYYNSRGHNARLTCRYYGISPQTFYRWKRHYNLKQELIDIQRVIPTYPRLLQYTLPTSAYLYSYLLSNAHYLIIHK